MDVEEKLIAIRKAAGEIRQIDADSQQQKKKIYADIKQELSASGKLESYLWECVILGLSFYEHDIERILRKNIDDECIKH
jgi:hypothetical protein